MYDAIMNTQASFAALPPFVASALENIYEGQTADSQESLTLEFKEDPSLRVGADRARAGLMEKLIDEAVCMANSDAGTGYIVVGVADKTPGPDAFLGCELGEEDVAQSIFGHTVPNMNVVVTEHHVWGVRLLVIYVPEARALYTRKNGAAKRRQADAKFSCAPMTEEQRRSIDAARRNPDFSNEPSDVAVEDLRLPVIEEARRMLRAHRQRSGSDALVPATTAGLLKELGLLRDDARLKRAGEILLADPDPTDIVIQHLWRDFPGSDPKVTEISEPILLALPRLRRIIAEKGNQEIERVLFDDGTETAIPRFPAQAVDEVVSNAVIHRDWRIPGPVVVEQSNRTLKVSSPGPLPPGVSVGKLLSTPSVPRNNRLMAAMRTLGLAEESSRGFDRMWAAMIRSGRDVPEVEATPAHVQVVLAAQEPDTNFVKGLQRLSQRYGEALMNSVDALIVLWHLNSAPIITEHTAAEKTQSSPLLVRELMSEMVDRGVLQAVRDADEWVLSDEARNLLGLANREGLPTVSVREWVEARLADGEALQASDIATFAGISPVEAGRILRHLRSLGRARIDPTGPQRGRGTRWISA